MLPAEIDSKVMEMVSGMRIAGAVVNYNILIAIAKGIVIANDRTLLAEHGGPIQLGWRWCQSIFERMKWSNRKKTTAKPTIAPGLIKEVMVNLNICLLIRDTSKIWRVIFWHVLAIWIPHSTANW